MTGPDRNSCQILLPSFALGLTTLAFIIAKTGRDALFFQGSGGLLQLPLIYINIGDRIAAVGYRLRQGNENLGRAAGAARAC